MNRQPVASSVIKAVGYDSAAKVLEIEFHTRRIYRYFDVPADAHRKLLAADSIGSYFNNEIKPQYRSEELSP